MFEAIKRHARALATARTFRHPHSVIKFANNGTFELAHTYYYWAASEWAVSL
jgi:hypothetical protein